MTRETEVRPSWHERVVPMFVVTLLAYWAVFALKAPVTVWDAQVYNLARLRIAELGGFFSNPYWTSERQIMFPLSFDAIHLPLLHLGFGYALPSYLCLVGTLAVVWHTLRDWHGPAAGWLAILALLAQPTLVFQAVGTKNDIALLFGVAVWFHAQRLWQSEHRPMHLVFSALALAFTAGAKSSGIPLAILGSGATLWSLHQDRKTACRFGLVLFAGLILLGSVETYIENQRKYGHLLGPADFVRQHANADGIRGGVANLIRYAGANVSTGIQPCLPSEGWSRQAENATRGLLRFFHLENVGYRFDFNDAKLQFLTQGWDAASDYGPVGTLALGAGLLALLWWRPRERWWQIALTGLGFLTLTAFTVAWMPWNNRFLLVPFATGTLGLVLLLQSLPRWTRGAFAALNAYAAVAYPLASGNKSPADLAACFTRPVQQEFKERITLLSVRQAIESWRSEHPQGKILLLAGSDSWVLWLLQAKELAVRIITPADIQPAALDTPAGWPRLLLILNRPDFAPDMNRLRLLQSFPDEVATAIYEVKTPAVRTEQNQVHWLNGRYNDGWSNTTATISLSAWTQPRVALEMWNPTPLRRTVNIASSLAKTTVELEPDSRRTVALAVDREDRLHIAVAPPFQPSATGGSPDQRLLGLRISISPP